MNGKLIRNLIVILGYIILIVLWFLKYKKRLKSKKDYMKRAELYYTSKKWLSAIDLGNNALSKFQVSSEEEITILLIIANSYYGLKEYNLAVDYYEKAFKYTFSLNKEYHYTDSFMYALEVLINLGRINDAKELFYKITLNKESDKKFSKLFKFAEKNNLI